MSDGNGKDSKAPISYNIVTLRGDPKTATTISGHRVEKKDRVIIPSPFDGSMITLLCADYHNEHFVYIDPLFERDLEGSQKQHWFAMCTCGAPAVIVGPTEANAHEGRTWIDKITGQGINENMLVCQHYMMTLLQVGHGWHANQDSTEWR